MAVAMETAGDTFKAALPKVLFETKITATFHTLHEYDVSADGQKFIINTRLDQGEEPITIYANWEREVRK